ncbi:MAG: thiamine diphosphokinase [Clostridia bacterium]|nr:thiamine diphosphokinase [Clostridia bacterium]
MRAVIIGNGAITNYDIIRKRLRNDDYIICADGGYNHTKELGVKPSVVIGDMDSIGDNDYDGEIINLPIRKDFTDSEVCVKYILLKHFDEVMMLGFTGKRQDHAISNLLLLKQFADAETKAYIVDENNEIYCTNSENTIYGKKGDIVSIIPITGNLCGVTTKGLDYPLNDETLIFGESRGVSNIMTSDKCTISIKSGIGLIIKARD